MNENQEEGSCDETDINDDCLGNIEENLIEDYGDDNDDDDDSNLDSNNPLNSNSRM